MFLRRSSKKIIFSRVVMWVFVAHLMGACAHAPQRPEKIQPGDYTWAKEHLRHNIQQQMKAADVVGLSIALLDEDEVVWAEGFGHANKEAEIPATADTLYRAGSVSKLFNAVAVMQMAEAGLIDIDAPLAEQLSAFSMKTRFFEARAPTPRDILSHHSGIPSDLFKRMFGRDSYQTTDYANLLREHHLATPPRTVFSYSNLAVTLLGHLVQDKAQKDYEKHVKEAVLEKLGMSQSSFSPTPQVLNALAIPYDDGGKAREHLRIGVVPAGALYATPMELLQFARMVFAGGEGQRGQVLKEATLKEMMRPQNTDVPLDLDFRIGLGFLLSDFGMKGVGPVVWHNGATLYFHTAFIMLPERGLAVAVMSNSKNAGAVVSRAAVETLKAALFTKTGEEMETPVEPPRGKVLSPRELQKWAGHYATDAGHMMVQRDGDGFKANMMGQILKLNPLEDGTYAPSLLLFGFWPLRIGELKKLRFAFQKVGDHRVLVGIKNENRMKFGIQFRPAAIPASWRGRLGTWAPTDAEGEAFGVEKVELKEENGVFLMEVHIKESPLPLVLPLRALNGTQAITEGLGRNLGETLWTSGPHDEEVLNVLGYRLKQKKVPPISNGADVLDWRHVETPNSGRHNIGHRTLLSGGL